MALLCFITYVASGVSPLESTSLYGFWTICIATTVYISLYCFSGNIKLAIKQSYIRQFFILWPYIQLKNEHYVSITLVFACVVLQRVVNILLHHKSAFTTEASHSPYAQAIQFLLYTFLASTAIPTLQRHFCDPIIRHIGDSISRAAFAHIISLPYQYHTAGSPEDMHRRVYKSKYFADSVESILFSAVPNFFDLCFGLKYLYTLSPLMVLVIVVTFCLYLYVSFKLGAEMSLLHRESLEVNTKLSRTMSDAFANWKIVNFFGRVGYERDRHMKASQKAADAESKGERKQLASIFIQAIILHIGLTLNALLAVLEITAGRKNPGSFVSVIFTWGQISNPILSVAFSYRSTQKRLLEMMELLEIFEKKLVIDNLEADNLCLFKDKIEFDNIGLSHDNKRLIFSNINFEIPKGHTVALVGKTGGGKSSLLNLATRLFEPTSGTIRIDGHNIRGIKTSSLRKMWNPKLFNTTIMENLKYANLNATDQQVHDACRAAGIHDTIMEFPDQYDTIVGHREIKLSGGDSQRISIARIILLDPQIILLDEVTSNFDRTTE